MSNPLKKTMVFLGLAEEDFETTETESHHRAHSEHSPAQNEAAAQTVAPQRASVTPLRRVTPVQQSAPQPMNEILTVHPVEYRDVTLVAESFRDGVPVIVNLSRMNESEAKRLIDFASGLTMGLFGRIERVTSKVFLLTPSHIHVGSGAESREEETGSFFVSSAG